MKKAELEERLIDFAVLVIDIVRNLPEQKAANHLAGQLLRSGTSPALNYAEAQSGESRRDFIHKMKIALKELRETNICLRIIDRIKCFDDPDALTQAINENNELISIFVKSVSTAIKNAQMGELGKSSRFPNR